MTQQPNPFISPLEKPPIEVEENDDKKIGEIGIASVGFVEKKNVAETEDGEMVEVKLVSNDPMEQIENFVKEQDDAVVVEEREAIKNIESQSGISMEQKGSIAKEARINTENTSKIMQLLEEYGKGKGLLIANRESLQGSEISLDLSRDQKCFMILEALAEELMEKLKPLGMVMDIIAGGKKKGFKVVNFDDGKDLIFVYAKEQGGKAINMENQQDKLAL